MTLRDRACIVGVGETSYCRAPGSGMSQPGLHLPVEVAFEAVTPEITLPKFRRASEPARSSASLHQKGLIR